MYLHRGMQVLVLQHTYDTLHMSYACTVLPLPLSLGPRDTFCVSDASYNDLNLARPKAIPLYGNGVRVAHHILFYPWEQGSMVGFQ